MKQYWFTADTHFGHLEAIKVFRRPFKSVDEMAETLVVNWNSMVQPRDVVYHLGDFGFWTRGDLSNTFHRLQGYKILIVGNHDSEMTLSLPWVDMAKAMMITVAQQAIWLSHYPQSEWTNHDRGTWHLYGHTHRKGRQNGLSLNVGVDCWHYHPVSFDAISRVFHADSALQEL